LDSLSQQLNLAATLKKRGVGSRRQGEQAGFARVVLPTEAFLKFRGRERDVRAVVELGDNGDVFPERGEDFEIDDVGSFVDAAAAIMQVRLFDRRRIRSGLFPSADKRPSVSATTRRSSWELGSWGLAPLRSCCFGPRLRPWTPGRP